MTLHACGASRHHAGLQTGVPLFLLLALAAPAQSGDRVLWDVVIYGGTSAGVIAAVQTARMGRSVVLLEPGRHLGGLTSGGLGATDIGNKAAIGGLARGFYRSVGEHYARDEAWRYQERSAYRSPRRQEREETMWTFEPHVAEMIFRRMIAGAHVPVVFGERLDLDKGVRRRGTRIVAIRMESGRTFQGRVFIDATYEGDLMAGAGVSYHVGREANATYGETLNGVQTRNARHHQFMLPVDPWVVRGRPESGLLPGIDPTGPGEEGSGDHRVQAYNFRMCLTDVPENRLAVERPADYDPLWYELLLRYYDAGFDAIPWHPTPMPNRKTDTNNNHAVSTDFIGQNYAYAEADYATRERIVGRHLSWQKGLLWCLAHEPRVPERIRNEVARWGPCRDEFTDNGGWSWQIYVREARRMVGSYVMTQHDCQGRRKASDPVGLAAYTMDSHNVQRHVRDGRVLNEGDVQVGGFPPYPISLRALIPKRTECTNLLVPVCLSASHIAFGSIRMEPVFMVLGQSAATAACRALEEDRPVQNIDYARLRARLLADGQVLRWGGAQPHPGIDPRELPGIVLDDDQAHIQGLWTPSTSVRPFVGHGYRHDGNDSGVKAATFEVRLPEPGRYEVRLSYTPHPNRAPRVPVRIETLAGPRLVHLDQRRKPEHEHGFTSLGLFRFGGTARVTISTEGARGYVVVDAVQLLPGR